MGAAVAVRGRHWTWILDDGRSDEVQALARELGCRYVRRLSGGGAKAGNLNHALSVAKGYRAAAALALDAARKLLRDL